MRNLLLTLGHNSSAIMIENGRVIWGYETERVTGLKSDSRFPVAVLDYAGGAPADMVYVSHWAPDGQLRSMSSKHWNPSVFDGVPIRSVSAEFTHHDAHMMAALSYAGPKFPRKERAIGVVVDGFGTTGEHFSVYDVSNGGMNLLERIHGYGTSLGLWYQYATAFLGMKMHEDEYKMLGYEAHVDREQGVTLHLAARETAESWVEEMGKSIYGSDFDPLYDVSALANIKQQTFGHLTHVAKMFGVTNVSSTEGRAVMAFYVQRVLELVVLQKIERHRPTSLVLSGGVFYNVKLNRLIVNQFTVPTCVYPLAGDQGCALGLFVRDYPNFAFPEDLFWGARELRDVGEVPGLTYANNEVDAIHMVDDVLRKGGVVNLVRGAMEFGPRALCNTSTLALPTLANVERINAANERNTVMPMAPVMTLSMYKSLFEGWEDVHKSHQHMIVALEYKEHPLDEMLGIAHGYVWPYKHHTGRPQVLSPHDPLNTLLHAHGPLINTSFNFHGMPIALDMPSIVENHMMQYKRDNSISTVVVKNA